MTVEVRLIHPVIVNVQTGDGLAGLGDVDQTPTAGPAPVGEPGHGPEPSPSAGPVRLELESQDVVVRLGEEFKNISSVS